MKNSLLKSFKKITAFTFFILLMCCAKAQTGNPVVDATGLQEAIRNTDMQKILDFVNAARRDDMKFTSYEDMISKMDHKNFIYPLIRSINRVAPSSITPSTFVSTQNASPQGGSFQSAAINAVAGFIAERFKQEMEIAFIEKFKEWLNGNSDESKALKALFPLTATVLAQNNPEQYTTFLETLKEALKKDVNNLPLNLGLYLKTDPFQLSPTKDFYFPAILLYVNTLGVIAGQPVTDVLNNISKDTLVTNNKLSEPYNSIIRSIGVLSRTLTNPQASSPQWLTVDNIKLNLNSPEKIKIFFGLLMIKEQDELNQIKFNSATLYDTITGIQDSRLALLVTKLEDISAALNNLNAKFRAIVTSINNNLPASSGQIGEFLTAFANTLQNSNGFISVAFNAGTITNFETAITLVNTQINNFVLIKSYLAEKNYGLAFTQVVSILADFFKNDASKTKTLELLKKYGSFAISVAASESQAEMQAALESAALPIGSYRIKRNAYANISINAYAGVSGGWQKYTSSVPDGVKSSNGIIGFTAPVGVAFSWSGKKDTSWRGSSNTLFFSIADLGALTSYRLTHDSTEALPEVKFKNVIAPAAYYAYGFKKIPLSAGLGVQYGPQLRKIEDGSPTILPSAWSIRLFLAVDIPFFNLYSRTEERKKK